MANTEEDNNRNKTGCPQWQKNRAAMGARTVAITIIPIIVLGTMILYLSGPGQAILNKGIAPLPGVTFERIEFQEGKVVATIRNTGPTEVAIMQADVNDRIYPAAIEPGRQVPRLAMAKVIIPFPWNAGEPYEIGVTTSDGTRFSKSVTSAAPTATPTFEQTSFFALIGTYVGIIPILIGLLWFPVIRRLGANGNRFFMSLTAGLLVFLGIDAILESNGISTENIARVFNGQILIAMTIMLSFLTLQFVSTRLVDRAQSRMAKASKERSTATNTDIKKTEQQTIRPLAIALMISIGIGLHNFGEGLAIGAAVVLGEVTLGTFLIIGFTLHNTTEGLAIVAPIARVVRAPKTLIKKLFMMGFIAGAPTIVGAWIGGLFYSPLAAIIFLSIGAGAIFQVVFTIYSSMIRKSDSNKKMKLEAPLGDGPTAAGFAVAMFLMYITGLLVAS